MSTEDIERKDVALITPYSLVMFGLDRFLEAEGESRKNGKHGSLVVTRTAQTPEDALYELARKPLVDVALIDLAIGDCDPNLAFVGRVRELYTCLPIVTISQSPSSGYLDLARSVGAQEHLSYHCEASTLCETLRRASRAVFPYKSPEQVELPGIVSSPALVLEQLPEDELRLLTPRQRQIYILLGEGKNYHEIGDSLGIKHTTVGVYYQNMAKRLGCENVNKLRYRAIRRAVLSEFKMEEAE